MKPTKTVSTLTILTLFTTAILMSYSTGISAASPYVPDFTVQVVDHSYDVPPAYRTDPYTGQTVLSQSGYHVDNSTIDVTIAYQAFYPSIVNGNQTHLYYNVRSKGHFEDWTSQSYGHSVTNFAASDSGSTVVSFFLQGWGIPQGGQVDFQVQAVVGYQVTNTYACGSGGFTTVSQSDWSDTKTLTIGTSSTPAPTSLPSWNTPNPTFNPYNPTPTPYHQENPTATPSAPNFFTGILAGSDWTQTALIVMAVVIACFVVVVAVLLRRIIRK